MRILILIMFIITVGLSCNKDGGGHRQNQEAASAPSDYTSGKDVKQEPDKPAERSPDELREPTGQPSNE